MGALRYFLIFLSSFIFVGVAFLSVFWGDKALPMAPHVVGEITGQGEIPSRIQLMKNCLWPSCVSLLARRILKDSPRNPAALGALAVSLCQRGQWTGAEPIFTEYFAEGGRSPEVQKWYQRLQMHQASNMKRDQE